jgi:hypothetical protein
MFNNSPAPAALAKRVKKAFSSARVMFSLLRPPLGVSGSPPPPCTARLDRHDVAHIRDVESHIWLTI